MTEVKILFVEFKFPKKLIPKEYVKNLWKYNLPCAWRLIYSIESNKLIWFS